jgi:hypothetical protein
MIGKVFGEERIRNVKHTICKVKAKDTASNRSILNISWH